MLDYSRLSFQYEPFPFGVAPNILDRTLHEALARAFPDERMFKHLPDQGARYSLYESLRRSRFLSEIPVWKEFYHCVKQGRFVAQLLDALAAHAIDVRLEFKYSSWIRRLLNEAHALKRGHVGRAHVMTDVVLTRIPADGGYLLPHTDAPSKVLSLVLPMNQAGEWKASFGGGTNINLPKDRRRVFNYYNERVSFDEVDVLHTVPFAPCQGLFIIKTFNSWHSIAPMTGPQGLWRKTVNINLLRML